MAHANRNLPNGFSEWRDSSESKRRKERRGLRILAWVAGSMGALAVVCAGVLAYLANSGAGHRYLLNLAERKAAEALGVGVQLENFTLHPGTLSLDLYGIRIAGAAPHPDPPLFRADHIHVGVRVVSIFKGEWYFDHLQIDHPVAWVVIDKDGRSNLPTPRGSGSSRTDLFDLGIRHFQITRGEVYYNARPSALAADLHDLEFQSAFNILLTQYSGSLAYADGRLQYGGFRPIEHDLAMEFEANRRVFTLKSASVKAGASEAELSGTVTNYGNPEVQAQYRIVVDGRQAGQILNEPRLPWGLIETSGRLAYRQQANRSPLASLTMQGDLRSARLLVNTASAHLAVSNLGAHYSLANADAVLHDLRAEGLGGTVTADGAMEQIGGDSHSKFRVALENVSLAEARRAFARAMATDGVSVDGRASATATAEWGRTIDDLAAHADLTLEGKAVRSATAARGEENSAADAAQNRTTIPFQGAVHAIYTRAGDDLTLNDSHFDTPQTKVTLHGTVSRSSSLAVHLEANDLREVATFADLFRAAQRGVPPLDLSGRATFQGVVRGSVNAPDVTGQLSAENLEYNGTQWKLLRAGIALNPAHAGIENLRLEGAQRGLATATASFGLEHWAATSQSPLRLDLHVTSLSMDTIAAMAQRQLPVSGILNASAHLGGEIANPTGHANATLTGAAVAGEPVTRATLNLTGSGSEARMAAVLQLPAGSVQADATTDPRARTFSVRLESSGIDLTKLETMKARGIDAKGMVELEAHGQGSFDNPALEAELRIPDLAVAGETISQIHLQLSAANHVANLEFAASVASAPLQGKARVNLGGDYMTEASLDTQTFALKPILAAFAPDEEADLSGEAEIHATLHGPLKDRRQWQAQVKMPVLKLAYQNSVQMAASPIEADLENSLVTVQPVTITGTDTKLDVQGSIPVGADRPASLKAQGAVNLELLEIFDPELRASGQLKINIDSRGAPGGNLLGGEMEIAGANLSTTTSPVGLTNGNGTIKLTSDRLELTSFKGAVGGGEITAQGAVLYRPRIQFDVGATAKGARLLYPEGVRESVDANLRLTGSTQHALLSGSVNLADISFTPAFDLSKTVGQFSGGVEAPPTQGFAQNLYLNIALHSLNNANLVSRTLSVGGSANLQVRGTAAEPVILGRVNLTGGDMILNGNRFVLTGGWIQFVNPAMTQPVLNVALTTTIQEYKIDLRFQGESDRLRTQYTSDPSLPSADIINLLAFGQTTEASAMNQVSASQQAEGLVASQVSSQVTSRISRAAGISQLSISPVLAGGTAEGPPGANITIQQKVTGNLFVTFSTNVVTTEGQTIQGQYQVSPRVAVSATRDPNGGFALDTIIKKSW